MNASLLRMQALAEGSVQEAAGGVSLEAVTGTEPSLWFQEEGADFWLPRGVVGLLATSFLGRFSKESWEGEKLE